jgi:hypothetical protein
LPQAPPPDPLPAPAPKQDASHPATKDVTIPTAPHVASEPQLSTPSDGPVLWSVDEHCGESCCAGGFFAEADYLFMRARRRAMDFVLVDPVHRGVPEGTIESLEWEDNSGVRAGGGYHFCEGWEVGAYYTYFQTRAQRTLEAPPGGTLFATLTHPGGIEQVQTATADSSLKFNVVDVEVGRWFDICDSFAVRCFGGARFAWIDQNLNAFYNGGDANHAAVSSPINFDGAGIRIGGEGRWKMGKGFSLYARGSGSLLEGRFRTHLIEINDGGAVVDANVSDRFEKLVPVAELGLGVAWEYRCFQVRLGYEMSNWFNMVDSPDFVDDVHQAKAVRRTSDLSLDGLLLQVGLNF